MKIIYLFLISTFITGCGSWGGYKPPTADSESFKAGKITIKTQNFNSESELDTKRLNAINDAAVEVSRIFSGDEFKEHIESIDLIASCDNGKKKVTGSEVLTDFQNLDVSVSVFANKPWLAEGLTDPVNSRIAINPKRIDAFYQEGGDIFQASLLIETLAHELAHMVPETEGETFPKYRDRGHGKECSQNELVSYVTGKLARAIWIHYLVIGNVIQK